MEAHPPPSYEEEKRRLKKTVKQLQRLFAHRREKSRYAGPDFTEQMLDQMHEKIKTSLQQALMEPYFGRLDFQEDSQTAVRSYYIGKTGVMDDESKEPIILDWRAPLSSLFYSFSGGEDRVFFEAPEGVIEGKIHLKRNIVIRDQQLLRVVDSYIKGEANLTGTDEFLLYKLGESTDHRLRDIVSSIQAEQNEIIRSSKDTALLIQGVAGSGKTTVALHRLAFLLYHYRKQLKPDRMMIFAPSQMFLDYISEVLPELGVGNVQQSTFADWAMDHLSDEIKLENMAERHRKSFECLEHKGAATPMDPRRYKGSASFRQFIRRYLALVEESSIPARDFTAWEGKILTADTLQHWYQVEYSSYPLLLRRERILSRIKRWIEGELKELDEEKHLQRERRKKANQRLRTFAKQWLARSPFDLYRELFIPTKRTPPSWRAYSEQIPAVVKKETALTLEQQRVAWEDLAPLLTIQFHLFGLKEKNRLDHVVIDEAQDFSPFQIALLTEVVRKNGFTILGDLAQGIHGSQGTSDWQSFQSLFPEEKAELFELTQSYRSTMEIIRFSNHIIDHASIPVSKAVPVFRSGEPVKWVRVFPGQSIPSIYTWLQQMQQQQAKSTAVITRMEPDAIRIHQELSKTGVSTTLIDAKRRSYTGGVSVLPVYLAKGLEFDAVLLVDVNERNYRKKDLDAKLLYVGCTRALHQLWLMAEEPLSPLIQGMDPALYEDAAL